MSHRTARTVAAQPTSARKVAVVTGLALAVGASLLSAPAAQAAPSSTHLKSVSRTQSTGVQASSLTVQGKARQWKKIRPAQPAPAPSTPAPAPGTPAPGTAAPGSKAVTLPPVGAKFDYQLGGAYAPPSGVKIVVRDRTAKPAAGMYNICYLNGFQTQPEDASWWQSAHPDLLLKTKAGAMVKDGAWNEIVLDVSTEAKRQSLLNIQKAWVDGCAAAGYQAIEADNQDSYSRSQGLFGFSANKAYMTSLAAYAHTKGLAVAQKNAAEEYGTTGKTQAGLDFAIAEECNVWSECGDYIAAFGANVLEVEYTDQAESAFTKACQTWGSHHSIVRRDRNLVANGQSGYSYATCR